MEILLSFHLFCWVLFRLCDYEKREYVEALEEEMRARNNLASVKQLLQEARNEVSVLLMPYNSFLILKI